MSRTRNSLLNIGVSSAAQIVLLLFQFISKKVFLYCLGVEYLGVNGVFTEILSVLSLAELGVASAITYSLYKPLAEGDTEQVKALMALFRRIYTMVGCFILAGGIIMIPALRFFIDMENAYLPLYFILFVADSAISYFYSYKQILITADQKNYIVSLYTNLSKVVQLIFQMVALLLWKSFLIYLIIQLVVGIVRNVLLANKANKLYPFLLEKEHKTLAKEDGEVIRKNVFAIVLVKVGNTVLNSTDNLIISSMIGVVSVGMYSNYLMVLNAVNRFVKMFFDSVTSSVGNFCVSKTTDEQEQLFYQLFYYNYLIVGFCSVCFYNLLNPFIEWWFGADLCFAVGIVAIIAVKNYITMMRTSVVVFRDVQGLYWNNRYKVILEALINLISSIILVKYMGIAGVFVGTIIAMLLVSVWMEPKIVFEDGMKKREWGKKYFVKYISYFALTFLAAAISSFICDRLFLAVSFISLIGRAMVCIITCVLFLGVPTLGSEDAKKSIALIRRKIKR